jgi:hypothetical protein
LSSRIRSPIACGVRKSNGVPATVGVAPVGISVVSTGVYLLALSVRRWS